MTYIGEVILIAVNILMAWYHSELIKDDKKIHHGLWGWLYLLSAGVISFFNHSIWLFVAALLLRKVVFDSSLNLFRGKALFYVSPTSTSIVDRIHYKLFGDRSEIYQTVYFLKLVFINVFFL